MWVCATRKVVKNLPGKKVKVVQYHTASFRLGSFASWLLISTHRPTPTSMELDTSRDSRHALRNGAARDFKGICMGDVIPLSHGQPSELYLS